VSLIPPPPGNLRFGRKRARTCEIRSVLRGRVFLSDLLFRLVLVLEGRFLVSVSIYRLPITYCMYGFCRTIPYIGTRYWYSVLALTLR
jgi:hypothetical protein